MQRFLAALVPYNEAFAEADRDRRLALLTRSMLPNAEIWGPKRVFAGYEQISEKIEGFQKNWPQCRLILTSGLNVFQNAARVATAIIGPHGEIRASGEAIIELADDGRIQRVIPFWEALPPLPPEWPAHFSPGVQQSDQGVA